MMTDPTSNPNQQSSAAPQERYLFKPFVGSSHSWAVEQCLRMPSTTSVLDIGSGSGAMGRILKENGFENLFAVEVDPRARDHVKEIYSQVEDGIEPFRESRFGLILLLDVLEHMTDPGSFLSQAVDILEPGGVMLISVPNVTHWSVRLPFLFGRFDYTERGILDKTHFRFFTRKSFAKMIKDEQRLIVSELGSSIEPAEFVLPKAIWDNEAFRALSRLRVRIANLIPGLFAYQHLALLRKRHD